MENYVTERLHWIYWLEDWNTKEISINLILNTVMDLMGYGKQVEQFWFSKKQQKNTCLN